MTYDEVVAYSEENNIEIPIFDNPRFTNSILDRKSTRLNSSHP